MSVHPRSKLLRPYPFILLRLLSWYREGTWSRHQSQRVTVPGLYRQ